MAPGDMVFCHTWLLHLFKQIIGYHADDNKLLRWTSSSSSSSSGRDKTVILRYLCSPDYLRISLIDGKSEKECKIRGLKSLKRADFVGCCNGLALFDFSYHSSRTIVVNPLSKEMETIYGPFKGGLSCGMFFHPLAKEYRILNVRFTKNDEYEYHIYLSGTRIWRKIANPYFSHKPGPCQNAKCQDHTGDDRPAIVNDALHWHKGGNTVLVFDIISEEFSLRTLPLEGRRLYVKDDQLCFCRVSFEEPVMDIWILEDYAKWHWVKKHTVNLDWDMNKYPFKSSFHSLSSEMGGIRVVSIKNNELVLFWINRGMFSCDLKFNTVEKLHLREFEMDVNRYYDWKCGFEAYN